MPSHSLPNILICPRSSSDEKSTSEIGLHDGCKNSPRDSKCLPTSTILSHSLGTDFNLRNTTSERSGQKTQVDLCAGGKPWCFSQARQSLRFIRFSMSGQMLVAHFGLAGFIR